jgi:hypothetical protein
MFGPRFPGSNGEALEIHAAIGEQRESCSVGQRESAHLSLDTAALPSPGCASLVAVVKTANLRYGNHGSQFRRLHRPRFRPVLGQREVRPGFVTIRQEGFHVPVFPICQYRSLSSGSYEPVNQVAPPWMSQTFPFHVSKKHHRPVRSPSTADCGKQLAIQPPQRALLPRLPGARAGQPRNQPPSSTVLRSCMRRGRSIDTLPSSCSAVWVVSSNP